MQVSRVLFSVNEAAIQTLVQDTAQEERDLVMRVLEILQSPSNAITFHAGISNRWKTTLEGIFAMEPEQRNRVAEQICGIFARVHESEHQKSARRDDAAPSENLFGTLPEAIFMDLFKLLSPTDRAKAAQVNRLFRELVRTFRSTFMDPFLANEQLGALVPFFCQKLPVKGHPESFDAWQHELESIIPTQWEIIKKSSVLTDGEREAVTAHHPSTIAVDPALLRTWLEVGYKTSLVVIWEGSNKRRLSLPILREKAEAAATWFRSKSGTLMAVGRIEPHGSDKMTCMPKELSDLPRLEWLALEKNQIHALPTLNRCSSLLTLDLSHNPLKCLPDAIGDLSALENLYLLGTQLRKLPSTIGALTKLKNLVLSQNMLESIPDSLCSATNLEALGLDHNHIQRIPESLGALASLTNLCLNHNQLTCLPESIRELTKLKTLHLNHNKIELLPESIGSFTCLKSLRMEQNRIGHLPDTLGGLTALEELSLDWILIKELPPSIRWNPIIVLSDEEGTYYATSPFVGFEQ